MRTEVAVSPHTDILSTGYENIDMEMLFRALHDLFVYGADSRSLWHVLHDALKDHTSCTFIRLFARIQDGGGVHLSLVFNNLGEYMNSSVLEEAKDNTNNVFILRKS